MTWVKLDDHFFTGAKAQRAGKDGRALYLAGLCFCAANLTDGVLTDTDLRFVAAAAEVRPVTYRKLIEVGLWEEHPKGFEVHDYLEYNPTAEQVKEERKRDAERKRQERRNGGKVRPSAKSPPGRPPGLPPESERNPEVPSHSHTPVDQSSSSGTVVAPRPDDEGSLLAKTWRVLAVRRLAKREAEKGTVGSREAWLTSVIAGMPREHDDEANALLASEDGWTPESLADALEPRATKPSDPTESTALAAAELRRRQQLPPCETCDSVRQVETEPGRWAPCPDCAVSA